jgi:ribonuclease P protein component
LKQEGTQTQRLMSSRDIKNVRLQGKTAVNDLIVIQSLSNGLPVTRYAVIATKSVGGAVQRNRCKRKMRPVIQKQLSNLSEGYDLIFIARKPILEASHTQLVNGVDGLCRKLDIKKV